MAEPKKILVLATGGTILSVYDPQSNSVTPGLKPEKLLSRISDAMSSIELQVEEVAQAPGPHLTPEHAVQIVEKIEAEQKNYDGFVIIQGTDTIEEFTYLVSLMVTSKKPIVFTGAMKSDQELYSDSLGNIASSIQVACCKEAWERGVLVVFNERIFSPKDIVKTHTSNIDSFQAPETGPLGFVNSSTVHFFYPSQQPLFLGKKVEYNVELFKVTLDSKSNWLDYCIDNGIKGIVIEGFGAGNIPPRWEGLVEKAIAKEIPVVITSRSLQGCVSPVYNYRGGGKRLQERGAIFARNITGPKARLKLMLLLGRFPRLSIKELESYF